MRVRNGFQITYDCPAPTPMMLMVSVHPSRRDDLETPDWVRTDPMVDVRQYIDGFGNICSRILAPAGRTVISADFVIRDTGLVDDYAPDALQVAVHNLPDDTVVYLLGSRYCETDRRWAGRACRPSSIMFTITSPSTISAPARPRGPSKPIRSSGACAEITPIWPLPFAAA